MENRYERGYYSPNLEGRVQKRFWKTMFRIGVVTALVAGACKAIDSVSPETIKEPDPLTQSVKGYTEIFDWMRYTISNATSIDPQTVLGDKYVGAPQP
ncbi:hypothetical protein A2865_03940 [Candidatus Woesebacteria bacterium RIFCSPHIGHO2_01_FULL_39_17]|uniref:Uncharacterized protein n=2 Tax=Candidatus Woeseibacteriota TaxID=1752722 RepID=A0A0G0LMA5_9BACT|nr:MAG: hypothetical protein UT19_C0020G0009 [Candidatus Woesebacteria bacterium GW2011_GWB1_39_10b]KKS88412.1 MAG: hypothetical protein UV64_C0023G0009 [Parcubacteria group bacterium GW2011_GWC1_43_11b]OGM22999.1 MAG: hypothetical protein A2865_03940 [Candidatus Woesebacteria bacterium RIFCSPHIGHO2_01_FULL_39_17]OGM62439.1 MAG: hypothetical protein A3A52_01955 [Candidatus Woesebacteria bacterium RIFCSPLOWO2_01_FULL_39_14]